MESHPATLSRDGFVQLGERISTTEEAFELARSTIDAAYSEDGLGPLSIIGDFMLPPADGAPTRDFQTLHFDFGLPLDPKIDGDLARYTALHVPAQASSASAATRLVPLRALLRQGSWPEPEELLENLKAYGQTHGAWDDSRGYVEGSLARIVEAAAGGQPVLTSVKLDGDFLCGLEFDSLRAETAFFARQGLHIEDVEVDVVLCPGDLLVFDNLALAHGRRGTRAPGELRQRVFGHRGLSPAAQCELRDRVLMPFCT